MQDLQSINRDPILDVIEDTSILKEKIEVDSLQADIWKNSSDDSDSHSKARYLGNQKKKKERIARSQSLRNILPIIMGNNPPPHPWDMSFTNIHIPTTIERTTKTMILSSF